MSPFTSNGPTDGENGTATPSKRFQYTCLGAVRGTLWSLLSGVHARTLAELVADATGFVAAAVVSSWPLPVQPAAPKTTTARRQTFFNTWNPFRAAHLARTSQYGRALLIGRVVRGVPERLAALAASVDTARMGGLLVDLEPVATGSGTEDCRALCAMSG